MIKPGFLKKIVREMTDERKYQQVSYATREETVQMNDGLRTLNDIMDATNNKFNYGQGTLANSNNQIVLGKYNVSDLNERYARITGGGTAAVRRNIETLDWNGNVKFAGTITTGNGINLNDVLLLAHPVGSYYWSSSPTNPSELFGGSWVAVKDKFILAVGDNYNINTSGGAASRSYTPAGTVGGHQLTVAELPTHSHPYSNATAVEGHVLTVAELPSHTHPIPSLSGTTESAGTHKHTSVYPRPNAAPGGTDDNHPIEVMVTDDDVTRDTSEDGSHTHPFSTSASATTSAGSDTAHTHNLTKTDTNSGSVGSDTAHSHPFSGTQATIETMPPYETAYCWRRIA